VDETLAADTRSLIASLRVVIEEFSEEGVDDYPHPGAVAVAPAAEPPEAAPVPSPNAPAQRHSEPAASADADWGETPNLADVQRVLGDCQRCGLAAGRNRIVFGDGNPRAELMFVGEGPGQEEDRQGLPFVGRAGELLTQMIEKGLGVSRADVYICNIVKCRPPKNRTPLPDEVAACRRFLDGQISAVRPKVIVALGKPATSLLLGRDVAITRERGSWREYRGIPLMPTLHPAYVLRQYTPENRRAVWEDLKAALARARE
jgi:uracil-DNA glycosylase family 4